MKHILRTLAVVVSKLYKGTNKFTGELDRVTITLTD